MGIKQFVFFILVLLLTACSSGPSDEKNNDTSDGIQNENEQVDDDSEEVFEDGDFEDNDTSIDISLGDAPSTITKISSPAFEEVDVENGKAVVGEPSEEAFVSAYDATDQIIFLGIVDPENPVLEVNEHSTVKALLLLVPDIAIALQNSPDIYGTSLSNLTSVTALAQYISNNADWSLPTVDFSDLYQQAIQEVLSVINPVVSANQSSQQRMIAIDNRLSEGEPLTYNLEKSGVNVVVNSPGRGDYNEPADTFTVELTNEYKRWAIAIIDEEPANLQGELDITSDTVFLLPGGGDPQKSLPLPLSVFEKESLDRYGVHVYGPAFSDLSGIPDAGLAQNAYWLASVYTMIFEVGVPTLGKVTGAKSCLREMFDPEGGAKETAKQIATSQVFRESIKNQNYSIAAAEVAIAMSTAISGAGSSCLSEAAISLLVKLKPIVGQAKLALDIAESAIDMAKLGIELFTGKSQEYIHIKNLLEQQFYVIGKNYMLAPTYGGPHYHYKDDLDNLDEKWSDLYTGNCQNEKDNKGVLPDDVTCEAYTFDGDGPYTLSFRLSCTNPVTGAEIACTKAVIGDTEYLAGDTGLVEFDMEVADPGEYEKIDVKVYDVDGGEAIHYAYLQIKQAQPQLLPYFDEALIESSVSEGIRKTDNKILLPAHYQTLTHTIELVNLSYGAAIINEINDPNIEGIEFSLKDGTLPLIVPVFGSTEIEVSVDSGKISDAKVEDLKLELSGRVGGESIAFGKKDQTPKRGDYSKLVIDLEIDQDVCLFAENQPVISFTSNVTDGVSGDVNGLHLTIQNGSYYGYYVDAIVNGKAERVYNSQYVSRPWGTTDIEGDSRTIYVPFEATDGTRCYKEVPYTSTIAMDAYRRITGSVVTITHIPYEGGYEQTETYTFQSNYQITDSEGRSHASWAPSYSYEYGGCGGETLNNVVFAGISGAGSGDILPSQGMIFTPRVTTGNCADSIYQIQ